MSLYYYLAKNILDVAEFLMVESYSELRQTSKMKLLAEIGNGFKLLTISAKGFTFDVWLDFGNVSGFVFIFRSFVLLASVSRLQ